MTGYSDEELLDALRDLGDELGERPAASDLREREGLPSVQTYRRRFGSWSNALEAAGYRPDPLTDEQCIEILQDLGGELGRTLTTDDVNERDDLPHVWTFQDRFGSWSAAIEAAGFDANVGTPIEDDELLDALEDLTRDLGRRPTERDMDEAGPYSSNAYRRHFGSWDDVLAELDMPPAPPRNRLSDRELITDLREFANYSGPGNVAAPSKRDMDADGPHSYNVYRERFGSWGAALVEAGLDPRRTVTAEDVIEEVRRVAAEAGLNPDGGPAPTVEDLAEYGDLSLFTVQREFDTWNEAVSAAGFVPNEGRPPYTEEYSDGEIVQMIRRVADELHETPTESQFDEMAAVSTTTVQQRFGSWHRALTLAGLRPRRQSPGGTPRGATGSVDVNRAPESSVDPRIDRVRIEAGGVPHILGVGDVITDRFSPLSDYRVFEITADSNALVPEWRVVTQPIAIDRPLTRTFYGDELEEWLGERHLMVRSVGR